MIRGTGRKKLSNSTGCEVIKTSTQIRETRKYALNQTRYTSTRNSPTIFAIRACCSNKATPNQLREKATREIEKSTRRKTHYNEYPRKKQHRIPVPPTKWRRNSCHMTCHVRQVLVNRGEVFKLLTSHLAKD